MHIGYIGLGKMGLGQVALLREKGYRVVAWNRSEGPRREAKKVGADVVDTPQDVCVKLKTPRVIWLMVPHGVVDDMLAQIIPHLNKGDVVIDGGNSFFEHTIRRGKELAGKGIHFLDVGTSGGPYGARHGACLMIGGKEVVYKKHRKLFRDLAAPGAYLYCGASGAGHFVKMVHNGIEYGMMQALGEGFEVMKRATFSLPLQDIALLYNRGSVIESRLAGWLASAYQKYGEELKGISGEVTHSGEGLWTVQTAKKLGVPVKVIKDSLDFRLKSNGNPSYTGQVVSALRNQFGGHHVRHTEATGTKNTEQAPKRRG